jgi:hypothetical protein
MNNEQMEEIKRHVGVVAEGVEHKSQLVAEGVANLNETFDRGTTSVRDDNERAQREILSAIKFSYAELDQRIRVLEGDFRALKTRMDRLERGRIERGERAQSTLLASPDAFALHSWRLALRELRFAPCGS